MKRLPLVIAALIGFLLISTIGIIYLIPCCVLWLLGANKPFNFYNDYISSLDKIIMKS